MAFKCSGCQADLTRKWGYCAGCEKAYRLLKLQRCPDCKEPLPKGRQIKRCTSCQKTYRQRHYAKGNRACQCGSRIPKGYQSHSCPDCRSMAHREYTNRKKARELL